MNIISPLLAKSWCVKEDQAIDFNERRTGNITACHYATW
jgi:hypothetical protein